MQPPDSESTILWRVGTLESNVREERNARRDAFRQLDKEKADRTQVDRIEAKVDGLQKTLVAFSFSAIFAGLSFIIGVLTLVGH